MEKAKTRGGGEVSSLVVTSTSEEGRLDQVIHGLYSLMHPYQHRCWRQVEPSMVRTIGSACGEDPVCPGICTYMWCQSTVKYCALTFRPLAGEPAKAERRYAHGIPR